jgi:hypothetical protein
LLLGSDVHEDIAKRTFFTEDQEKQKMLNVANNFLSKMPTNPVFETNFDDPNNPGVFKGHVFELPFLAVFDVHWIDDRIGLDWKTGNQRDDKAEYEIQAYILNELFREKYKHNLRKFYFVFLKDGSIYEAQSIYNGATRKRTETKILNVLNGVRNFEFKKRTSWACDWCDYKGLCI